MVVAGSSEFGMAWEQRYRSSSVSVYTLASPEPAHSHEHRLPSPQRGRGAGGEGDTSLLNQFPKLGSGWGSQNACENSSCVLAPSPLTPLPRWGEGDRGSSSVSRDEEYRHYIIL